MIFVIGCIFGLICALIASNKQRNPIGWFVIGFLLPLIGLILAIVLPENAAEPSPAETSAGEPVPRSLPDARTAARTAGNEFTRPCPTCGGLIHPAARTCMHCFTRVPSLAAR